MPVWRHFMPLKSARFLIGRLNQPNACGPDGRIGIQCDVELELLLEELLHELDAAAVVHPADGVDHVHAEGAAGAAGEQDRGLVLADPVARPRVRAVDALSCAWRRAPRRPARPGPPACASILSVPSESLSTRSAKKVKFSYSVRLAGQVACIFSVTVCCACAVAAEAAAQASANAATDELPHVPLLQVWFPRRNASLHASPGHGQRKERSFADSSVQPDRDPLSVSPRARDSAASPAGRGPG